MFKIYLFDTSLKNKLINIVNWKEKIKKIVNLISTNSDGTDQFQMSEKSRMNSRRIKHLVRKINKTRGNFCNMMYAS